MIAALESAGVEVVACHVKLWHGIEDRVKITEGDWVNPKFWWRVFSAYSKLIVKFIRIPSFDILMVGYPGQFDVFLAKVLSSLRKKPLVWDVFMSIYLVAKERMIDKKNPLTVKAIRQVEAWALKFPDLLIQDTAVYVNWFHQEYGVSPDRFHVIPTGADNRIFKFGMRQSNSDQNILKVLYYGTYIPNHGVKKIVKAAEYLKAYNDICFIFIGKGPERKAVEELVKDHRLSNIHFKDWMSQEDLLVYIQDADICLGAFGDTPQSMMTVQNKIFECMAMGKPVITGDSQAVRRSLPVDTIVLVNRDEPYEIARRILELKDNSQLREKLSEKSLLIFEQEFCIRSLGKKLEGFLSALINSTNTPP